MKDVPVPSEGHWLVEITAGARHIIHTPILRELSIAGILTVIAFGISETVAYAVTSSGLHRPPGFLGVLISLQGVGAVSSGAVAG